MPRTDIHAPTNLITENYEFWACGYYGSAGEPGYSPLNTPMGRELLTDGWHFGENASAGDCYHCGAHLKYYAILKHIPTHTLVRVGETCLDNRFELASGEFHRLRKEAKLNRERRALAEKRAEFLATGRNQEAYDWAKTQPAYRGVDDGYGYDEGSFEAKFVRFIDRYGEASEKFAASIIRSMERQQEWAAKRAEEAKTAKPVIEGRTTVRGEVVSAKGKETQWGYQLKLLIKDEAGFKVYGNCPSAIDDVQRGDVVEFTATLKASDDDKTFGFFSRPAGASILSRKESA